MAKIYDWPLPPPPGPPSYPQCPDCQYAGPFRLIGGFIDNRGVHFAAYALECPKCGKVYLDPQAFPSPDPSPALRESAPRSRSRRSKRHLTNLPDQR